MERITNKQLDALVRQINEATGSPLVPWRQENGATVANIGCYFLDYAYGGVKLARIENAAGGQSDISTDGFGTKRQLYSWMKAYSMGLRN